MIKHMDLEGLGVDDLGRAVLPDDLLELVDRSEHVLSAGGSTNGPCGGSTNSSCSNGSCTSTSNGSCSNVACGGSTNRFCYDSPIE